MEYKKGMKTVEDSRTEITKLLQYEHINGENRLFGGRLMAWIDEAAAVAAMRHAGGYVTTCAVDDLRFKKGAYQVRVDTFLEDRATGMRTLINHAYLVEVHVDEAGTPIPIEYGLELRTPAEKMEWDGARRRIEIRRQRNQEGF